MEEKNVDSLTSRARKIFSADRFAMAMAGVEIVDVRDHEAVCRMVVGADQCNARGVAMGGALFTLGDFAASVAASTDGLSTGELHHVSLTSTVHFLAAAPRGAVLEARCVPVKRGRTISLFTTTITLVGSGKMVATVDSTIMQVAN